MKKKVIYITDLSLPSNKAQATHIFKMLDNFLIYLNSALLICPTLKNDTKLSYFKNYYNLHNNKKIEIFPLFKKMYIDSSLKRIIFGFKVALKLSGEKNLVISRSLISSFFLSIFKVKHFLEIHQELKGITKFLLIDLKFIYSKHIIKVIFISEGLAKFYNLKKNKSVVLHDACDLRDFKRKKTITKKIKNIYYFGSFYKGRGIEIIKKLSNITPEFNYYVYGKRNEKISSSNNFKVFPIVTYKKLTNLIGKADLLLMPYQSKISISSENVKDDISKFISPLKMFEYMASGTPIISSDLKVLKETLIDRKNSILVKNYTNPFSWKSAIIKIENNLNLRKKISLNSIISASKNTWEIRVKKIIELYNHNIK